jgi:hypothetical protein
MRCPNVVYEDPDSCRNLLSCAQWATPGVRPLYDSWVHAQLTQHWPAHSIAQRPRNYVFPIGCFHNPSQWAQDPLAHLPSEVLRDAQRGRALLIFDQSQEGNADPQLWSWFYDSCASYGIGTHSVLYLTGDAHAEDSHFLHCEINGIDQRIGVISTLFNLYAITHRLRGLAQGIHRPNSDKQALFNCLNRMPHEHRKWFFLMLLEQGLVDGNMISMPAFAHVADLPDGSTPDISRLSSVSLPLSVDDVDLTENLFNNLNSDIYDRSWFTVITETYISDAQLLIGEKVFKPMLCGSPFMLLSTKHALSKLRHLGFETFPMLWDESYDHMDTVPRMRAMVQEIHKLSRLGDWPAHFARAQAAVDHNQQLAWQPWIHSRDCQRILAIWQDFVA